MSGDQIHYEDLAKEALRGVIKTVLTRVEKKGLPGEHHFYIGFNTNDDGVAISKRLKEQYPEEMTIVLQNQFWDLCVKEDLFEVRLSFNNIPELLVVPFNAIKVFFDPSVPYGLQFGAADIANDSGPIPLTQDTAPAAQNNPIEMPDDELLIHSETEELLEQDVDADKGGNAQSAEDGQDSDNSEGGADIVELDTFRKK